jgi:hypothetical protein
VYKNEEEEAYETISKYQEQVPKFKSKKMIIYLDKYPDMNTAYEKDDDDSEDAMFKAKYGRKSTKINIDGVKNEFKGKYYISN